MSRKEKIYNISICVLAIVSIVFATKDLLGALSHAEYICDCIIYIIFVADYVLRLIFTDNKKNFFKNNILDLVAIIPFNAAFRALRMVKAVRFLKFTKVVRIASVSARATSKAKRFFNTNGFKYVVFITIIAIVTSSVLMSYFENMTLSDAFWWSFVTTTTVGYGDLSPTTNVGRIIAVILMLVGIGMLGSLTSTITSYFMQDDTPKSCSSDKVDMVKTLYDKLSKEEKEQFKNML